MPLALNLAAASAHAARVLVGCGWPVLARYTSHITRMLRPPRSGSLHQKTGFSMQSDDSPVACSVDEPSNPQIGGVFTELSRIFVFDRSSGVGFTPSIQMYSAWYGMSFPFVSGTVKSPSSSCQRRHPIVNGV